MWQWDWKHRFMSLCFNVPFLKLMRKGSADACLIAWKASFMASKNEHITYPPWPAWWWQQQPTPCQLQLHRGTHSHVYMRLYIQYTYGDSINIKLTFSCYCNMHKIHSYPHKYTNQNRSMHKSVFDSTGYFPGCSVQLLFSDFPFPALIKAFKLMLLLFYYWGLHCPKTSPQWKHIRR